MTDTFLQDRQTCGMIYRLAAVAEPTGDAKRWPDVLSWKCPVVQLKALLRLMGILDEDLVSTVVNTGRACNGCAAEDLSALSNIVQAAMDEQARRA